MPIGTIAIKDGTVFGLKLKAHGGRLSSAQRQCHDQMRAAGAIVATCTGIDEALRQLQAWRLLRGTAGPRSPIAGLPTVVMTAAVP